ncbi:MAG: hypothetical protein ACOZEN_12990 [Thermodesulfobacteriota bacterium]
MDQREAVYRLHIHKVLYQRTLESQEGREESIKELLAATRPDLPPQAAECVAQSVPPLLPELHRKWIGMFVDRLFETADPSQTAILCDGSEENNAALALAYVMFLESERMEKVIAGDLENLEELGVEGMADVAAGLCARLSRVEESILEARQAKARKYQEEKSSGKTH